MKSPPALQLVNQRGLIFNEPDEWEAARVIQAFGVRVGLRANDPAWLERLTPYLPPLWKPCASTTVDRIFSLRVKNSHYTLYDYGEKVATSRSMRAALEDFERRLKIYVAEMARRRVFIHAGVVGWQGKAILIPGSSYSGKTSLVVALVKAGAIYYSDEYAVLDMQGRVTPYPQPLAIRPPNSSRQKNTSVESLGGSIGKGPLPVGLVFVSQYQSGARWRTTQLSAGQAALELLAHTVPARRKPAIVFPTLCKVTSSAIALKGKRGEAAEAAQRLLQLAAN